MTDKISIVINLDTRPGFLEAESTANTANLGGGTKSLDYFTHGVENKKKFFEGAGFDVDVTLFIDVHDPLPNNLDQQLLENFAQGKVDNIIWHRHDETFISGPYYPKWTDISILTACIAARGKYVAHFDQDMAAFCNDKNVIKEWTRWLDEGKHHYISYPSAHSPKPVNDPMYKSYWWASSRFFMFKREILDYTEIVKCLSDADYLYSKYGQEGEPKNSWLEHCLGLIAGGQDRVFYPPFSNNYLVFSWSRYFSGILEKLNAAPYELVRQYVIRCGGVRYPCDVLGQEI